MGCESYTFNFVCVYGGIICNRAVFSRIDLTQYPEIFIYRFNSRYQQSTFFLLTFKKVKILVDLEIDTYHPEEDNPYELKISVPRGGTKFPVSVSNPKIKNWRYIVNTMNEFTVSSTCFNCDDFIKNNKDDKDAKDDDIDTINFNLDQDDSRFYDKDKEDKEYEDEEEENEEDEDEEDDEEKDDVENVYGIQPLHY
jgi:hypothetical protein